MTAPTVLATSCRGVVAALEDLGHPTEDLLEAAGVDRRVLENPDGRLPADRVLDLWSRAFERAEDPALAVRVAERLPPNAYRVLEYMIACAATVGDGFEKVSTYFAWIDPTVRLPIGRDGDTHTFGLDAGVPPELVPAVGVEFTFCTVLLRLRATTGVEVRPVEVELAGPRGPSAGELERVLQAPLRFEAGVNQLRFDAETWSRGSAAPDPTMLAVLEGHAADLVARATTSAVFASRVRDALASLGPAANMETVARHLAVSSRTLQRRLAEEGTRFADVLDEVRADLAKKLLGHAPIAVAEVALVLGFADQTTFTRAFKRWHETTPAEYRRRARVAAPAAGE